MDPSEIEIWSRFLKPLAAKSILYAFENWQRNGRFFPKPKDILELVEVYEASKMPMTQIRYEHHGQGYGDGDMLALWKLVSAQSQMVGRALRQDEIFGLLGKIDEKRPHGAPEWRR